MFDKRANQTEHLDDFAFNHQDLRKNLDEMEFFNNWFGSRKVLLNALNEVFKKYKPYFKKREIVIGDLGCGSGDLLRSINQWAQSKKINVKLIGIDANPFIAQYAAEKSKSYPQISYQTEDILSPQFKQGFDIICINSLCHHFSDEVIVKLLEHLIKQSHLAIIINDLQRHRLSYFTAKWLSKLLNFSVLAKNDGPLSVLRAFHRQDLIKLLQRANITSYQLRWRWAFRWEIIIWCKNENQNQSTFII